MVGRRPFHLCKRRSNEPGHSAANDGSLRASTTQVVTYSPRRRYDDLPRAPTVQTAEILLDQAQGALRAEIARLADLVETDARGGLAGLDALIERGRLGLRLLCGWKVVIAGRPNVGKSRLLNALCGFHRAIVDGVPGTTRDVVAFQTAFGGWPVELADTAGLRATADAIEQLGMERTRQELGAADLVVLVLDRSESSAADRSATDGGRLTGAS